MCVFESLMSLRTLHMCSSSFLLWPSPTASSIIVFPKTMHIESFFIVFPDGTQLDLDSTSFRSLWELAKLNSFFNMTHKMTISTFVNPDVDFVLVVF